MGTKRKYFWRRPTFVKKLNTKGCCFLCFENENITESVKEKEIAEVKGDAIVDNGRVTKIANASVSLRSLRLYLQIKSNIHIKDWLKDTTTAPSLEPPFKEKEEEEFEVELCQTCGKLINKFSQLFQQLHTIQMKVDRCLEEVHRRASKKDPKLVQIYSKRMTSNAESLSQLAFVDKLRNKIIMRSSKMRCGPETILPLIRTAAKTRTTANNFSGIKTEPQPTPPSDGDIDDNDNLSTPSSPSFSAPPSPAESANAFNQNTFGQPIKLETKTKIQNLNKAIFPNKIIANSRKRFPCTICNTASFSQSSNLKRHQNTCRLKLAQRSAQILERQKDPRYKFECSFCKKRFLGRGAVNIHVKQVHQKLRSFACNLCDKRFFLNANLQEHKQFVHFGAICVCKFCKRKWKGRASCRAHEKVCAKNCQTDKAKIHKGPSGACKIENIC